MVGCYKQWQDEQILFKSSHHRPKPYTGFTIQYSNSHSFWFSMAWMLLKVKWTKGSNGWSHKNKHVVEHLTASWWITSCKGWSHRVAVLIGFRLFKRTVKAFLIKHVSTVMSLALRLWDILCQESFSHLCRSSIKCGWACLFLLHSYWLCGWLE